MVPLVLNFTISLSNPLGSGTISDILTRIITGIRDYIAPPIFGAMVIFAAFQILTAGDNKEKFEKGKKTLLYAVIGYALILISSGIIYIIKDVLGMKEEVPAGVSGPTTLSGVGKILTDLVSAFINIFWAIGIFFALWTAITFMSAGGDETKIKNAKKRLLYTFIAFVIAISLNAVILLIKNIIAGSPPETTPPVEPLTPRGPQIIPTPPPSLPPLEGPVNEPPAPNF